LKTNALIVQKFIEREIKIEGKRIEVV